MITEDKVEGASSITEAVIKGTGESTGVANGETEKAAETAEQPQKAVQKDPKTGKFLTKPQSSQQAETKTDAATPSYTPNFKFKVLDKEHEMEEWLRAVVKDPETEKKARELCEKALGIDSVKQDRQGLKTKVSELETEVSKRDSVIQTVVGFRNSKDYDSLFESLDIPTAEILRYALEVVKREQNPAEAQAWQAQRQAKMQVQHYESENQRLLASQQQLAVQQRELELTHVLAKPDVVPVAQAYEAGIGSPGAFKEYVVRIGQAFAAQGEDISAERAVEEALKHLRAVNPTLGQTQQAQVETGPKVVEPSTKPVIPNIQGRGTSPVRSTYKSLEELKKRGKELLDSGL